MKNYIIVEGLYMPDPLTSKDGVSTNSVTHLQTFLCASSACPKVNGNVIDCNDCFAYGKNRDKVQKILTEENDK